MNRSTRMLLMTGASVAAVISLTFAAVMAQDDEAAADDMDTMAPMEEMEPGLYVLDAWTRESLMTDLAGAAYMIIHNSTDADDALIGASSPAAEFVELHLSSMDDEGMMSMNQVHEVPIPARADAVLEPGGYHIMLINPVAPLEEGADVELSLEFMTADPQTVTAPVVAGAPTMAGNEMGQEMDQGREWDDMSDDQGMDADEDEPMAEDEG